MAFSFKNVLSSLKANTETLPKRVVGIDFGASSVKVVELEQRESALALVSYGELQLGPYAESDLGKPVSLEQPKKIEALVDVIRESNIKAKTGVLALPLVSSFVTVMSMTAKDDEDISPRVRVEARKYIPVPINDVTLDWTELGKLGEAKTKVREILVAAVQNESLVTNKDLMAAVEMQTQAPEIELFSTIRAITKSTDKAVAIIDLGAKISKMYIAQDGLLRRIHRVHAGGMHATEKIASILNIPFVEAENMKRNYHPDMEHAADVRNGFVTSFERPMQEFKRALEQTEVKTGTQVGRVVVSGGSAAFADLPHFASYIFDRDVKRANPFTKVAYPAFMEDTLEEIAPTFTVALGLALRPYN